ALVPTQDQRSEFERWYASQPRVPLIVPAEGAKVLVVKFNDFQCPACGQSYLRYKPIFAKHEAEHPGAVKLVLKDYPLNRDCNDAIGQSIHSAACEAAVAVRLAQGHRKTEAMEQWRYTHDLTKDYRVGFWRKRPYRALDRLTLTVESGEVFGFLGPNGAGKTTTLKLLMQLVFPTAGGAEILGRPLGDLGVKRRLGYLPENPYFYDHLTAEELLTYFGALFGYDAAERRRRAAGL